MDAPAALNRKLNRALRHTNLAGVTAGELPAQLKRPLLDALTNVIFQLSAAQRALFAENPELEYHFEPDRPPTEFMRQIQRLADDAKTALDRGAKGEALAKLQEALSLEPPPLPYEILEKKRDEILRNA